MTLDALTISTAAELEAWLGGEIVRDRRLLAASILYCDDITDLSDRGSIREAVAYLHRMAEDMTEEEAEGFLGQFA